MIRVTNIHKNSRSDIRTHNTVKNSPTLREKFEMNRNLKNYISGVDINYFFFDSRKEPRIKAGPSNLR